MGSRATRPDEKISKNVFGFDNDGSMMGSGNLFFFLAPRTPCTASLYPQIEVKWMRTLALSAYG
jgi:hypothetical protein